MDGTPRDINGRGLTPIQQEEWNAIYNNGHELKQIIFLNIPYSDHDGNTKTVVGAVYSATRKSLPPRLPALLPPLESPPVYAICNIAGKGKGIKATRNIALGEVVINERPVLIFPCFTMQVDARDPFPMYAKQSMAPEDWREYNDLMNVKDAHIVSKFDGIRNTNGFGIFLKGAKESYGGVFLQLSRLNHSCGPNVRYSWNPYLFTSSVQAVRPIRTGEELTVSYEDVSAPHATRRSDLQQKYIFDCTCGYCTNTSPTSDVVRALAHPTVVTCEYGKMYNDLIKPGLPHHVGQTYIRILLDMLIRSLVSITEEGIQSASAMLIYMYLMKVYGLLGDKRRFKKWGFKAVLTSVNAEAEDDKGFRGIEQWIEWVKEPEKRFPDWGLFR